MSVKEKNKLWFLKWLITAAILVFFSCLIANGRGFSWKNPFYLNARYLSDGFFVTGLITTGIGGLVCISATGFFDIFGYAFKSLLVLFSPLKRPNEHPTFYDYKTMKAEKRKESTPFLLVMGLITVGISVLFLVLYYKLQ